MSQRSDQAGRGSASCSAQGPEPAKKWKFALAKLRYADPAVSRQPRLGPRDTRQKAHFIKRVALFRALTRVRQIGEMAEKIELSAHAQCFIVHNHRPMIRITIGILGLLRGRCQTSARATASNRDLVEARLNELGRRITKLNQMPLETARTPRRSFECPGQEGRKAGRQEAGRQEGGPV